MICIPQRAVIPVRAWHRRYISAMTEAIDIVSRSDRVESLLAPYKSALGPDYVGYRNHVLRVLTYAMHFVGGDPKWRALFETALAYHDIGMWSDHDLAYLQPSVAQALAANEHGAMGYDPALLTDLIEYHHKVFPYRGDHADLVNAIRRADWVDATSGKVRKGLTRDQIDAVTAAIPVAGFPEILMRLARDLSGGSQVRGLCRVMTKVYRW